MKEINYLDLFSGIGGFPLGLLKAGFTFNNHYYSEIDKYAIQIYKRHFPIAMKLGDINGISSKQFERPDIITLGFPCFPKGTLILTKEGHKNIENIEIGDLCYTHKGRYMPCIQTMNKYYEKDMYKFSFSHGIEPFSCTEEHPILISTKIKKWNNEKRLYNLSYSTPFFKKAKDITEDDYFMFSIPIEKEKPYDKYLMEFLGFYLAEGWYAKRKKKNGNQVYQVYLGINKKERGYVQSLVEKISVISRFKNLKKYKVHFVKNGKNSNRAIISSEYLWNLVQQFGSGAKNKQIPYYFLSIDKEYLKPFIIGYYNGDGNIYKGNFYSATTTSKELTKMMQLLILKSYNYLSSVSFFKRNPKYIIEGRQVNQSDSYTIRFKTTSRKKENFWFIKDNILYIKNKKEIECGRKETVYNIGIKEDESYTVNIFAVHNCQDMSIAGTREGFGGQRSSLFFRAIEIINEVKPKYFIFENVKGLFSSNKGRDFEEVLQTISNIGYDGQWQLLNTKWVLPQNRERIYFVGYPRGNRRPEIFPIGEGEFNTKNEEGNRLIELTHNESDAKRVYSSNGIAKTLKAVGGGLGAKTGLYQVGVTKRNNEIIESGISNAVDANYHKGLDQHQQRTGVKVNSDIRRLTPMECERLQGFPDNWTEGISDTQRYRCIGNAVSVPIVELIMRRLYDQF